MIYKKVLVFDFDGTLVQSLDLIKNRVESLSSELGITKIEEKDIEKFRGMGAKEFFKEIGIPLYKLPLAITKLQKLFKENLSTIPLVSGISEVLIELKRRGFILGVLSSNTKENVTLYFQKNGFSGLWNFIYCGTSIFGKHRVIAKMLKDKKLEKDQVLYFGDEVRDIEACKKVGIKMVAVTWGFNNRYVLEKYEPDYLIEKPEEIHKISLI